MAKRKLLSEEEVKVLLDFSHASETKWRLMIASSDLNLYRQLTAVFADDRNVSISRADNVPDAMLRLPSQMPHVLVLDEELREISPRDIIRSIKSHDDFKDLQIYLSLKDGARSEMPDWGVDDYIIGGNTDRIYISRKVMSLLGAEFDKEPVDKPRTYERRWPRTRIDVPADLEFINNESDKLHARGSAIIQDISRSGAQLADIDPPHRFVLGRNYRIRMKIADPPLSDLMADTTLVRLGPDRTAGLKFVNISKQDQMLIAGIFDEYAYSLYR